MHNAPHTLQCVSAATVNDQGLANSAQSQSRLELRWSDLTSILPLRSIAALASRLGIGWQIARQRHASSQFPPRSQYPVLDLPVVHAARLAIGRATSDPI